MSTWDYRVIKKKHDGNTIFHIHEVYYDESGAIESWTMEPIQPMGETESELREDIYHFVSALGKETLEEAVAEGRAILRPANERQG